MARPYFTLVSRSPSEGLGGVGYTRWAIEFGDYNRQIVEFERDDMRDSYPDHRFKILRTSNARQATINAAVAALNA